MEQLKVFAFSACLLSSVAIICARNMGTHTMEMGKMSSRDGRFSVENKKSDTNSSAMEGTEEELHAAMSVCNATYPTPMEYLIELNETGQFPVKAPHDAKCYLNCLFIKLKLLDENGSVNPTVMDKWFDKSDDYDSDGKVLEKCFVQEKKKKMDQCEFAYESLSCLMKEEISFHSEKEKEKNSEDKGRKM